MSGVQMVVRIPKYHAIWKPFFNQTTSHQSKSGIRSLTVLGWGVVLPFSFRQAQGLALGTWGSTYSWPRWPPCRSFRRKWSVDSRPARSQRLLSCPEISIAIQFTTSLVQVKTLVKNKLQHSYNVKWTCFWMIVWKSDKNCLFYGPVFEWST